MFRDPSIVAVIPTYEQHAMTRQCVRTLREASRERALGVVVVDDGSNVPHRSEDYGGGVTVVRRDVNGGYTEATNLGITTALETFHAEVILLLNNDIEFRPGSVDRLISGLDDFDMGGLFGRVVATDRCVPAPFVEFSCALIRASVFRAVGLLDSRFERGYYSDDDFCLRARIAGFRIGQVPEIQPPDVIHHTGASHGPSRRRSIVASHPIFLAKWREHEDPRVAEYIRDYLWNPNLRAYGKMFELHRPAT